jgi:hypothetical protein
VRERFHQGGADLLIILDDQNPQCQNSLVFVSEEIMNFRFRCVPLARRECSVISTLT